MAEFIAIPNRDAYAAILGYRYQVDWTILQWCQLQENEFLELECGEDIDKVSEALADAAKKGERRLEQIKHLSGTITLKNSACLESFANFVRHRQSNPDLHLFFAFCTNARVTSERPSPFTDHTPGIHVWQRIQRTGCSSDKDARELLQICEFLQNAKKPSSYSQERWDAFQEFLQHVSETEMLAFVRQFIWSVGQESASNLSKRVGSQLVQSGFVATHAEAREFHARLFLYVFTLLSQKGEKRLCNKKLLDVAAQPPLQNSDKRMLTFLQESVLNLEDRLKNLEDFSQTNRAMIEAVEDQIKEYAKGAGSNAAINAIGDELSLTVPQKVDAFVGRSDLVEEISNSLIPGSALLLRGLYGSGKTQLAIAVYEHLETTGYWLSLRNCSPDNAARRIDILLRHLAGICDVSLSELLSRAFSAVGEGGIVILEDIPRIPNESLLSRLLEKMFKAIKSHKVRLLLTSHYALPSSISGGDIDFTDQSVPPFTIADTSALVITMGESNGRK